MEFIKEQAFGIKKGIIFYLFLFVFFITPNLPMPTSGFGPIGPALYVFLIIGFVILVKQMNFVAYRNKYFYYSLVLTMLLVLSDTLKMIMFDTIVEAKFLAVRLLNFGIFFIYAQFYIANTDDNNYFTINNFFFKVYIWSVFFISLILFGQAFGFVTIGEVFPARTYFGLKLPFNKPVGLVELSDGKLGIIIVPIVYLGMLSATKVYSFFKLKWPLFVAFLLFALLIIMQSRSGYLGFFVGLGLFILLYPSRKLKLYTLLLGAISTFYLIVSGLGSVIIGGLVGEGIYERNVNARGVVLEYSVSKFYESPLYGVGHKALVLFTDVFDTHGVGSHNLFVDHLGSGGLLSFIPFMLIFVLFYYYSGKDYLNALKEKDNSRLGFNIWIMVSMLYVIVELVFYRGFYNEYLYFFLALGTIPFLNVRRYERKNNLISNH